MSWSRYDETSFGARGVNAAAGPESSQTLLVTGLGVEFRQTSAIAGVFGVLRILFPTG